MYNELLYEVWEQDKRKRLTKMTNFDKVKEEILTDKERMIIMNDIQITLNGTYFSVKIVDDNPTLDSTNKIIYITKDTSYEELIKYLFLATLSTKEWDINTFNLHNMVELLAMNIQQIVLTAEIVYDMCIEPDGSKEVNLKITLEDNEGD